MNKAIYTFKNVTPVYELLSKSIGMQRLTAEGLYSAVYETANNSGSVLL